MTKRIDNLNRRISVSIDQSRNVYVNAENELLAFKKRFAILQQAELDRRKCDLLEKEERALNHGKLSEFFKGPMLGTGKRKLQRLESSEHED